MRKYIPTVFPVLLLLALSLLAEAPARPERWAKPIALAGVPNLHQVSDGIYRSAQPAAEGFHNLASIGVQRVLSLRQGKGDERLLGDLPLTLLQVEMTAWFIRDQDVIAALRLLQDAQQAPILVHCRHGADRTGVVCAAYRIVCQNWTTEEAIAEMVEGDFGHHKIFNNIRNYLKRLRVEEIRQELAEYNPPD